MGTQFADELKARLAPIQSDDLDLYIEALGEMFAEVEEYGREHVPDDHLPWAHITDPAAASNYDSLFWLAQLAGVRVPIGLSVDDTRTFIELAESRRRGTLAYMVEIVQRYLTGTKTVVVTERVGDNAYLMSMVTQTDETPDPAAAEAAVRAVKPAGIILEFNDVGGYEWHESVHSWTAAGATTWDDSATVLP